MSRHHIDSRFEGLVPTASGAMGSVYKGWDRKTGRAVAVKVPSLMAVHRFWRETGVLAQLVHPNVVRYVDRGRGPDGVPWLAMEWLEGEDLETRLARGPLSVAETLALAEGVASALTWAHARRFVHRDLKPSNLFLVGGDAARVKVLDFGLARATQGEELTATGMFMGTLEYVAPEQASDAKRASAGSDVFSFGAVLFHCLTGTSPIESAERTKTAWPPRVSAPRRDVPEALARLVTRMLARAPAERPTDGAAVAKALAELTRETRDEWEAPTQVTGAVDDLEETREWPSSPPPSSSERPTEHGPSGTVVMPSPRVAQKR